MRTIATRRTLAVVRVKPPARRNVVRTIPVKRVAGTPVRKVVVRTIPPRRKAVVRTVPPKRKVATRTVPPRRKVATRTVPPKRKVVVANPPRRKVVARVIPSKRREVVVRRIPPKRSISRKVALAGGIKKSVAPQGEGWRFALSAAMSSALRGDFGVPFGGLLQLDARLESFSLGVSVSFQQQFLLEQSDVSVLTPALIARWEFSQGAFFARLGAGVVAECLWVTNQQALVFAYRLGVRGELSLGFSLTKQLELYVGLAYHQFFTKDQFQRQGSDFFNVNPWQLHGFIGLTYRF